MNYCWNYELVYNERDKSGNKLNKKRKGNSN